MSFFDIFNTSKTNRRIDDESVFENLKYDSLYSTDYATEFFLVDAQFPRDRQFILDAIAELVEPKGLERPLFVDRGIGKWCIDIHVDANQLHGSCFFGPDSVNAACETMATQLTEILGIQSSVRVVPDTTDTQTPDRIKISWGVNTFHPTPASTLLFQVITELDGVATAAAPLASCYTGQRGVVLDRSLLQAANMNLLARAVGDSAVTIAYDSKSQKFLAAAPKGITAKVTNSQLKIKQFDNGQSYSFRLLCALTTEMPAKPAEPATTAGSKPENLRASQPKKVEQAGEFTDVRTFSQRAEPCNSGAKPVAEVAPITPAPAPKKSLEELSETLKITPREKKSFTAFADTLALNMKVPQITLSLTAVVTAGAVVDGYGLQIVSNSAPLVVQEPSLLAAGFSHVIKTNWSAPLLAQAVHCGREHGDLAAVIDALPLTVQDASSKRPALLSRVLSRTHFSLSSLGESGLLLKPCGKPLWVLHADGELQQVGEDPVPLAPNDRILAGLFLFSLELA